MRTFIILTLLALTTVHAGTKRKHLTPEQISASIARIHQVILPAAYQRLASSMRHHGTTSRWRTLISSEIKKAQQHSGSFAGEVARARVTHLQRLQELL